MRFTEDLIEQREIKTKRKDRDYDRRVKQMYRHAQERLRGIEQSEHAERRMTKFEFINLGSK